MYSTRHETKGTQVNPQHGERNADSGNNPDKFAWSHAKRPGVACSQMKGGVNLQYRVDAQLQSIANASVLMKKAVIFVPLSPIVSLAIE